MYFISEMVFEGKSRIWDFRKGIIVTILALAALSGYGLQFLKYTFDFEQFFPKNDPEYLFFKSFIEEFESDDNFLLIALENDPSIFDYSFLSSVDELSQTFDTLENVISVQSITTVTVPQRGLLGINLKPVLDWREPAGYARDSAAIMSDERFVGRLVEEDASSLVIFLKTIDGIQLDQAEKLIESVNTALADWDEDRYHVLGRANFQREMIRMQKREITVSTLIAGILVTIIFFIIYRHPFIVFLSLTSIALGFVLFMGLLSLLGRELNAMSALYPIIMIIVGSSDVIHIISKYIDEINKGLSRIQAMRVTIKEIGTATLLTSITTAIGFSSLLTSKIGPVRDFGVNAGMGVLIAFITVILFTTAAASLAPRKFFEGARPVFNFWNRWMQRAYYSTLSSRGAILVAASIVLVIALIGLSKVSTDYRIEENLPRGEKVTKDFLFFDEHYYGFRPFEIAVFTEDSINVTNQDLIRDIARLEGHLKSYPDIQGVTSLTMAYKSMNRGLHGDSPQYYKLPEDSTRFEYYSQFISDAGNMSTDVLVSRDRQKTRISGNLKDVGADSIKNIITRVDNWIESNMDHALASYRQTGTGIIIDRNAEYVRNDLIYGLGLAIVVVSILMALLYQNARLLIIALVPNLLPLLIAAAALGYASVELEAGISIIFAVVFGIAVDDTIHFLSKYRLARGSGLTVEESLLKTFVETGKAICLTTVVLFFGFMVMLFSIHPPSRAVGILISVTLISAVFADLFLIPLMIRWLAPKEEVRKV